MKKKYMVVLGIIPYDVESVKSYLNKYFDCLNPEIDIDSVYVNCGNAVYIVRADRIEISNKVSQEKTKSMIRTVVDWDLSLSSKDRDRIILNPKMRPIKEFWENSELNKKTADLLSKLQKDNKEEKVMIEKKKEEELKNKTVLTVDGEVFVIPYNTPVSIAFTTSSKQCPDSFRKITEKVCYSLGIKVSRKNINIFFQSIHRSVIAGAPNPSLNTRIQAIVRFNNVAACDLLVPFGKPAILIGDDIVIDGSLTEVPNSTLIKSNSPLVNPFDGTVLVPAREPLPRGRKKTEVVAVEGYSEPERLVLVDGSQAEEVEIKNPLIAEEEKTSLADKARAIPVAIAEAHPSLVTGPNPNAPSMFGIDHYGAEPIKNDPMPTKEAVVVEIISSIGNNGYSTHKDRIHNAYKTADYILGKYNFNSNTMSDIIKEVEVKYINKFENNDGGIEMHKCGGSCGCDSKAVVKDATLFRNEYAKVITDYVDTVKKYRNILNINTLAIVAIVMDNQKINVVYDVKNSNIIDIALFDRNLDLKYYLDIPVSQFTKTVAELTSEGKEMMYKATLQNRKLSNDRLDKIADVYTHLCDLVPLKAFSIDFILGYGPTIF